MTRTIPILTNVVFWTVIGLLGCSSHGGNTSDDDLDGDIDEPTSCDEFDRLSCDCPYGTGFRYCLADQSGYGECVCVVSNAVVGDQVFQVDLEADTTIAVTENGELQGPITGNESLANLQPGDFVQSWRLGMMGKVVKVSTENDTVTVATEACALTDVFETLDMDLNRKINVASAMPEEMKNYLRTQKKRVAKMRVHSDRQPKLVEEIEGETEPVAGVTLSFEGEFDIGADFHEDSYIDFTPALYTKLRIKNFQLQHAAIDASVDLNMLLKMIATVEASASGTAELDIFKLIAYFATGEDDYVTRINLGGGLELEMWLLAGISLGVDGHIEVTPYFSTNGYAYGGAYYSRNWDDLVWDSAPDRIQQKRLEWSEREWHTVGDQDFSSEAGLSEFSWGAHGGIEGYLTSKYALSFLRCGGPTFDVQPYIGFDAWIGDKNKLEAAMGVRGHVGGKIEVVGEETIWEDSWELFDYNYILWEYSWMLCGDGVRSTECYDLECDHCPNAGCGGTPEECDAGIFFAMDGQGSDELGDARPCIPPGQEGACTCGVGWKPATGDEWFWPDNAEDDVQWGDKKNWCVRTCGNGVIDEDEGEVCDHRGSPGCDSNCNDDCTAPASVCGNGVKECYEECDDGNTNNCDGCSQYCTNEPGAGGCGDGYRCGEEECDDGNEIDCDTCHNDCTRNQGCGDGHRCGEEECDDGNLTNCDECFNDCTLKTGCGDGHTCGTEECDDGNQENCDTCTTTCKTAGCGDGFICGDEVCDDGNTDSGDGCRFNCMGLEECGDGLVDHEAGEQCDDGNDIDCDECYNDCQYNLNQCGDGHVCGDEVCDDGNHIAGDGCRPNCMGIEECGDGLVDQEIGEVCDDGNIQDCVGNCSADCRYEVTGECGDHVVCGEEVCDDGNIFSGDGCRGDCMGIEECGDGLVDVNESCEDTSEDGIDLDCTDVYPDCVMNCHHCQSRCGDGVLAPGEACEIVEDGIDLNCNEETPICSNDCQTCKIDCSDNICGDGKVCGVEVCDDGNNQDCMGTCSADCMHQITGCGDSVVCGEEVCDDGNTSSGDGCRSDCMGLEICGDGLVDTAEACEDSTLDGVDLGCPQTEPDCVMECHACSPRCGDGVIGSGEVCEDSSLEGIDTGCSESMPVCSSNCHQCLTNFCGDGAIHPPEVCDGAPLDCVEEETGYAGERECVVCLQAGPCIATESCGDGQTNGNEICDDGDKDSCTRTCSADCMHADLPLTPTCGDGILECGEVCDDGNNDPGDGCSADCLSDESCGNHITDYAVGELCDDGNHVDEDGCSADCRSDERCGNGVVDAFLNEVCDDGNNDDCQGNCASDCSDWVVVAVCGDGEMDEACEQCEDSDPSNTSVDTGCTLEAPNCRGCSSCSADVCGDGIVGPTETCDEGGWCADGSEFTCTTLDLSNCEDPEPGCRIFQHRYSDTDVCSTSCEFSSCGDGMITGSESCEDTDPSNTSIDEGCDAVTPDCSSSCGWCGVL